MSIIDHIEAFLGPINEGWKLSESSSGIKVIGFREQPFKGVVTYVTLGLSEHALPMPDNRNVRQELVFSADERFDKGAIASFLATLAEFVLSKSQALLRGDVIGPSAPIISGVPLNAVYAAIPVVYDDGFATYKGTTPPTVLVWIIPLHEEEAEFVKRTGWSKFEEILEITEPDLWDLNRARVPLD